MSWESNCHQLGLGYQLTKEIKGMVSRNGNIDPNRWYRVKELGYRTESVKDDSGKVVEVLKHEGLFPYSQDYFRDLFENHPAVKIEGNFERVKRRRYRSVFLIPGWAIIDWLEGRWQRPRVA
jgi:hypothetical protein